MSDLYFHSSGEKAIYEKLLKIENKLDMLEAHLQDLDLDVIRTKKPE